MKTTKEFPATHSMSTEWFVADEEGNIALFSFEEEGPVPIDIPRESNSYLMTAEEDFGEKDSNNIEYLELTDEQVEELMRDAVSPENYNIKDDYCLFVQVDEEHKKEFLEVFIDNIEFCLSHKHGIYFLYSLFGYEESEFYRNRALNTFYKTVKRVVYIYDGAYCDENFSGTETKWPLPFYCYYQPYNSQSELAKRTNVPKYPFTEEQISERQRKKLIRIPVKFSECTGFQIAQYAICRWRSGVYEEIDNKIYTRFPKTEGGYCYILDEQNKEDDGETPIVLPAGDD
jgi:hypothetical protein